MAQQPFPGQQTIRPAGFDNVAIVPLGTLTLAGGVSQGYQALAQQGVLGQIANLQSVWCDASLATAHIKILNQKTRQYAVWPKGSVGWTPLLIGNDATQLIFSCDDDAVIGLAASNYPFVSALQDLGEVPSANTSRRTDFAAALASAVMLPLNNNREGFSVWNDSPTDTLYLLAAPASAGAASSVNFTIKIAPAGYYEQPFHYGGEVRGAWSGTSGGARVTEFF